MKKCFGYLTALNLLNFTQALVGKVFAHNNHDDNLEDHGFGKLYKWRTVAGGFNEAKINRRPIMVVIHKLGCPACEKIRSKFANSLKLLDLSQHFVMVNLESATEQQLPLKFIPDGGYVPRILFFCPEGKLLQDIVNQDPDRDPQYKYHYWSIGQIVDSMLKVLSIFPPPAVTKVTFFNHHHLFPYTE